MRPRVPRPVDDPLSGRLHRTADLYLWEKPVTTMLKPTEIVMPDSRAVHRKVAFGSTGTYIGGLIVATLVQGLQDGSLLTFLSPTASAIVAPLVPALLTFLVGYMTTNKVGPDETKALAAAVEARAAELVEAKVADAIDAAFATRRTQA